MSKQKQSPITSSGSAILLVLDIYGCLIACVKGNVCKPLNCDNKFTFLYEYQKEKSTISDAIALIYIGYKPGYIFSLPRSTSRSFNSSPSSSLTLTQSWTVYSQYTPNNKEISCLLIFTSSLHPLQNNGEYDYFSFPLKHWRGKGFRPKCVCHLMLVWYFSKQLERLFFVIQRAPFP